MIKTRGEEQTQGVVKYLVQRVILVSIYIHSLIFAQCSEYKYRFRYTMPNLNVYLVLKITNPFCTLSVNVSWIIGSILVDITVIIFIVQSIMIYFYRTGANAPSLVLGHCTIIVCTAPTRTYRKINGYDVNFVLPGSEKDVMISKGSRELFHVIGDEVAPGK